MAFINFLLKFSVKTNLKIEKQFRLKICITKIFDHLNDEIGQIFASLMFTFYRQVMRLSRIENKANLNGCLHGAESQCRIRLRDSKKPELERTKKLSSTTLIYFTSQNICEGSTQK